MALLAAFALYRLNAIIEECLRSAQLMEGDTGGASNVRVLAVAGNWSGVVTEIQKRLRDQNRPPTEMQARLTRLQLLLGAHRRVLIALCLSLGLTALVVAGSISVLAYVPTIAATCAHATLTVGIAATVLCLITYLWLAFEAFRSVT
jgi:hypothetical protein